MNGGGMGKMDRPGSLPALVLAYVGDAVFELAVRRRLVEAGLTRVKRLHVEAVKYVNAGAQARILTKIGKMLTGEEAAVVRRGRNAKSPHTPQGVEVLAYRHSTAFEALVGYLYLKGDAARLDEILAAAFEAAEGENEAPE